LKAIEDDFVEIEICDRFGVIRRSIGAARLRGYDRRSDAIQREVEDRNLGARSGFGERDVNFCFERR
jgi:hypothetical protein